MPCPDQMCARIKGIITRLSEENKFFLEVHILYYLFSYSLGHYSNDWGSHNLGSCKVSLEGNVLATV